MTQSGRNHQHAGGSENRRAGGLPRKCGLLGQCLGNAGLRNNSTFQFPEKGGTQELNQGEILNEIW